MDPHLLTGTGHCTVEDNKRAAEAIREYLENPYYRSGTRAYPLKKILQMLPEIELSEATTDELSNIQELAETTWNACYPGIITAGQIRYMLEQGYQPGTLRTDISERNIRYLLAREAGTPVGFGAHGEAQVAGEIKLHKLYVHPDRQRCGIGARIVEHISRERRDGGFQKLILAVNKGNLQAIRAYHKYGFTHRESVVVDIGDGYVMDDYILELVL